ncbi:MAG: phosphotransferase [Chloroflexota bacterium]
MRDEVPLGGNLNDAVRVGDTVRRRGGPWTPAIHALLRFLEREGFAAPRVIGIDEIGREVLGFIEGGAEPGHPLPLPDAVFREDHMVDAARHLRRYHDVVERFTPPPDATWRLVSPTPHEIICHNDWSPWNALFRNGRYALTLDWDLAGPGPRLWDVANAAYCWVPLFAAASAARDIEERARRLRIFCVAYDLVDRSALIDAMRARVIYLRRFMQEEAKRGDPGFMRLVDRGTPGRMADDVDYLDEHRAVLERALD